MAEPRLQELGSLSADVPSWPDVAPALIEAARAQGWRVKAFRLTEDQRDQLKALTGQKAMLFGYPVREAWRDDAAARALIEACRP